MSADLEADSAAAAEPPAPAGSPCNSVCRMDDQGVYCIGCFRTLDEIAGWAGFDDARRRLVWAQLSERRTQAGQAAWMPRR